jgi:hypothetical protein
MDWRNGIGSDDENNDEDGDGDGHEGEGNEDGRESQVQEEDMTCIPPCYARCEFFCSVLFFLLPYG